MTYDNCISEIGVENAWTLTIYSDNEVTEKEEGRLNLGWASFQQRTGRIQSLT